MYHRLRSAGYIRYIRVHWYVLGVQGTLATLLEGTLTALLGLGLHKLGCQVPGDGGCSLHSSFLKD